MAQFEDALAQLKRTISKSHAKGKGSHEETIGQVSSYLVFMKSSVLSQEATEKLAKCLRERLIQVYAAFPQRSLEFAAALCQTIYETKVLPAFAAGKHEQKTLWEKILNALLSGVLDFHDAKPSDKFKEAIGVALYPTVCSTFFSISIPHMSVELRSTGYSVLSETADSHKGNQARLLDPKLLGGVRLGSILWRTRDFLVLESILNLFARILPVTGGTAAGRSARSAFIRSVFVNSSSNFAETGEALTKVMDKVRSTDWDRTASKIISILASSSLVFPQPFSISRFLACDHAKSVDTLYVDEKGFVANILVDADCCDTLSVPHTNVTGVNISYESPQNAESEDAFVPRIIVSLNSPPMIGKEHIWPHVANQTDSSLAISFQLTRDDVSRFCKTMKSRDMGHIVKLNKSRKSSVLASPAKLEMDTTGNLVNDDELAQRIDTLSQLYGTEDRSDEILENEKPPLAAPANPGPEFGNEMNAPAGAVDLSDSAAQLHASATADSIDTSGRNAVTPITKASSAADRTSSTGSDTKRLHLTLPPNRAHETHILDDELSGIEGLSGPPKAAATVLLAKGKPRSAKATLKARRVVDSDDEGLVASTATDLPVRNAQKTPIVVSDGDDEIEEILPASKISPSMIPRRRSTLAMAPIDELKTLRSSSKATVFNDARIAFVDSDTAVPISEAESGRGNKKKKSLLLVEGHVSSSLSPRIVKHVADGNVMPIMHVKIDEDSAAIDRFSKHLQATSDDEAADLTLVSSPVVPLQKAARSVRAALRNKNGATPDTKEPSSHVKKPKRKRSLNPPIAEQRDVSSREPELQPSPAKRRKQLPDADNEMYPMDQADNGSTSLVVRPKKRYGGRKGKMASPAVNNPTKVDYDLIPDAPTPATSARQTSAHLPSDRKLLLRKVAQENMVEETKPTRVNTNKQNPKTTKGAGSTVKPAAAGDVANEKVLNKRPRKPRAVVPKVVEVSSPIDSTPVNGPTVHQKVDKSAPISPISLEDFIADLPTMAEMPHTSTPKRQPGRKSNKKPWNNTDLEKSPETKPASLAITATAEPLLLGPAAPQSVKLDVEEAITIVPSVEPATTIVSLSTDEPPNTSRLSSSFRMHEASRKEPTIDLTVGSPPKQTPAYRKSKKESKVFDHPGLNETDSELNDLRLPNIPKLKKASVAFASEPLKLERLRDLPTPIISATERKIKAPVMPSKLAGSKLNREHQVPAPASKAKSRSPSIEDIAEVLNEIQEAVLRRIQSKVEGVRREVRVGQARLLADAVADLTRMRSESITRYNLLIDMEADYATFGRNLTYAFEDLVQTNTKIEREIKDIIQAHNQGGLLKKAPESLFPTALPKSILAFRTHA